MVMFITCTKNFKFSRGHIWWIKYAILDYNKYKLLYNISNLLFSDIIYGVIHIIFMLMMEHLYVVCAIGCVIAMFMNPKLLKVEFMIVSAKALPFGT